MEFWDVKVSSDKFDVKLGKGEVLRLTQACLEEKDLDPKDRVYLQVTMEGKKLTLGTLDQERHRVVVFDLVFEKDFQFSHTWEKGSVYFYGYKFKYPCGDEGGVQLPVAIGNEDLKKEKKEKKEKKTTFCKFCNRKFKDKDAFVAHNQAKHMSK